MAQKAKPTPKEEKAAATAKPKAPRKSRAKPPEEKQKVGRKTKFEDEKTLDLVYKLALLGCTDEEMADILNINPDTFHEWKKVYPEFSESLTRGKSIADAEIAESMYNRARGWRHTVGKPVTLNGKIEMVIVEEAFPPDTKAATIWLTNRQGRRWRDKQEQDVNVNHTFEDRLEKLMKEDDGSQPS